MIEVMIEVRQGDILHVPYPQECLQYLAVDRDKLLYLQNGPLADEIGHTCLSIEAMTYHWHGVHVANACQHGKSFHYSNPDLVWRD